MKRIIIAIVLLSVILTVLSGCNNSLINQSSDSDIFDDIDESTESETENGNVIDDLISINPKDYLDASNISTLEEMPEEQKVTFYAIVDIYKDIVVNGKIFDYEKTYELPKRVSLEDFCISYSFARAQFSVFEDIVLSYSDAARGTFDHVDQIELNGVIKEKAEQSCKEYEIIDSMANEILSSLKYDGTEYGKALVIAEWLTDNVSYAEEVENILTADINSAYTALTKGEARCGGYAQAYDFLCKKAGLETIYVYCWGELMHAWNMIHIDDDWYHIDVTWMDNDYFDDPFINFMMPDIICKNTGHEKADYYNIMDNPDITLPNAESYKYYKFYRKTAEEAVKLFKNESLIKDKEYVVAFDNEEENKKLIEKDGMKIVDADGSEYNMYVYEWFSTASRVQFVLE